MADQSPAKSRIRFGFLRRPGGLLRQAIQPATKIDAERRRGLILNILLLATISLSLIAMVVSFVGKAEFGAQFTGAPPWISGAFLLFFSGLYAWSRLRYSGLIAFIYIGVFTIISSYTLLMWGPRVPQGLLMYALIIGMSGILLGARLAIFMTTSVIGVIVFITVEEAAGRLHPNLSWMSQSPSGLDAIGFAFTLGILALVSGLSTREAEQALERARRSEAALRRERDNLEETVAQRSRELEQEQIARAMELHRFTEFGRVSAGFLHDITNPLTAAILHLDHLTDDGKQQHTEVLKQARQSVRYVERYVEAARKQLQEGSDPRLFDVGSELELVMNMLEHRARQYQVRFEVVPFEPVKLFGDPVRFNQLAANLLTNAIEAYDAKTRVNPGLRKVRIEVAQEGGFTVLRIRDWGKGLPTITSGKDIFAPFYSTKSGDNGMGLGLGLAIVKRISEREFNGSVTASSYGRQGTAFEVKLGEWHGQYRS